MTSDPQAAAATTAPLGPRAERAQPSHPFHVPGYRVLEVLGEGGMGTVYAAEQLAPRRRVAIKVLHARSGPALIRFDTEAQAMARLDHPGIARVLEAGDSDGRPFLVMEHVDGATLDRAAVARSPADRLALFAAICDAVHHAHLKGVVHRDLKPSNVMVRDTGQPVVLDFGLARLAADDGTTPGTTRAGELLGTPLYMSPEQAQLRADQVDARSDIYTLGVMLYELACGELPYASADAPIPALICMICDDPPIPLAKRKPALRGDLDAITATALAKAPNERYRSAAALAEDVRRYLDRRPVSVRNATAVERVARFVRRRPIVAAAITAGLAAVAAFAIAVTVLWRAAEASRGALEARSNQLTLRQARVALARDPTEALAWLATMTPRDVDAGTAWGIADEAIARGVAKDVLRAHADEVHWVEPLPGGGFVTASYDGTAVAWTGEPPRPHVVFTAAHGRVHAARPAANGELAVGGDAGELHVLAPDGRELATLTGHVGDVQHLAWSADGAWLATGDDHGNLWAWPHGRAPGRQLVVAAPGSAPAIESVAFSAHGETLVSGDRAGAVRRWDLAAADAPLAPVVVGAAAVEVWTDGTAMAAVDADGNVARWHAVAGALVADGAPVATGHKCKRAVFAVGGAWAVLGGVGGTVTLVSGPAVEPLAAYRTMVRSLAISPDGKRLAAASDDGALEVFEPATGRAIALRGHSARVRHLAFTAAGELLSADADGAVRRWDLAAMPPTVLDAHGAVVERMAVRAGGNALATVDAAGEVLVWGLDDASHRHVGHVAVPVHETRAGDAATVVLAGTARPGDGTGRVMQVALVGDVAVTGTAEGELCLWHDPPTCTTEPGVVKAMSTSGDDVAVGLASGRIEIFATGRPPRILDGNTGGTETVAFAPRGELLASGGQDRVVKIWRRAAASFELAATLDNPHGDTHFVAFSPDGGTVIAAANDGSVVAWTVHGGDVDAASARVVTKHVGAVTAIAIDPASQHVASAGRDGQLIVGDLSRKTPPAAVALSTAGIAVTFASTGDVFAVTRAGAVERWTPGTAAAVVQIDHGIRDGVALPGDRWALAYDDGTVVVTSLRTPPLAELPAALAAATSFTLPETAPKKAKAPGRRSDSQD